MEHRSRFAAGCRKLPLASSGTIRSLCMGLLRFFGTLHCLFLMLQFLIGFTNLPF